MEERLSPEGAQRLRVVRDRFIEHPETYCFVWESACGTQGCVAGHLTKNRMKRLGENMPYTAWGRLQHFSTAATKELGFTPQLVLSCYDSPLRNLFYKHDTAESAVRQINKFLWTYGYPENEIVEPAVELALVGV